MIKRTLYFGTPAYLRKRNDQLIVEKKNSEEARTIPIEDIALIIVDHNRVSISHGLCNALLEQNAAILWCDNKHLPNGLLLPLTANHTYSEKLRIQLDASVPLKKQLWRQTVKAKITNQAEVLEVMGFPADRLRVLCRSIQSGDPENKEGQAAAYYWRLLLDPFEGVTRNRFGEAPNHLFNYGYAILRSVIARSLVASGCMTALGIHHHNKYNPFCLADDIMEPYRPIIDLYVFEYLAEEWDGGEEMTKEDKFYLMQIPVIDVSIEDVNHPLMVGAQKTTAGLMQCFEGQKRKIPYPEV